MSNQAVTFTNFKDGFDSAPVQANKRVTFSLEYILTLYAQAIHETAKFTSRAYNQGWNLFGMRTSLERDIHWQVPKNGTVVNSVVFMNEHYQAFEYRNMIKTFLNNGKWSVSPYAYYDNWLYSLIDRIDWDTYNNIVFVSVGQYMDAVLARKYAEDTTYRKKWVATLNQLCDTLGLPRLYIDDANTEQPVQPTGVIPVAVTGFQPNAMFYVLAFLLFKRMF